MAKIVFPSDISFSYLRDGNKAEPKPMVLESPADYPVKKQRLLATFIPVQYSFTISLNTANSNKLLNFYLNTVKTFKPFEWTSPYNQATKIAVRFTKPPIMKQISPTENHINITIETALTADI